MVNIGVNLPGVDVNVGLGNTPANSTPANQQTNVPQMPTVRQQMLIPTRDNNGAVVSWVLRTIEYDTTDSTMVGRPRNFNSLAPWNTPSYKIISTP